MKKALIAMSIAAGMVAAAHAENTTTLYGSLGYQTQIQKSGGSISGTKNALDENRWDLDTTTAKFGIKGTEDLSNGTQAFFKFEFGADTDGAGIDQTRYAYIGLKGDSWGTITLGKQDSLYKNVVNFNDIFEAVYYGDNYVHFGSKSGGGRISKVLSYVSPNWSGFQFGVAGVLDGSHTVVTEARSKSFDAVQAGVWYNANGIYAGLAYSWLQQDANSLVSKAALEEARKTNPNAKVNKAGREEVIGTTIGYANDQFRVGFGAEHAASSGEVYNLAGEYYYGDNTFRAGLGYATKKTVEALTGDKKAVYTYALGYKYNLSKRTYAWVEGEYVDYNHAGNANNGYTVKVGLRHNF